MSEHVSQFAAPPPIAKSRLRSLVIPREHGAWGMLLVPLATGAAVALRTAAAPPTLLALIVATIAIFWVRTPIESWLGTGLLRPQSAEERNIVGKVVLSATALAALALIALFWGGQNQQLLFLGIIAATSFAVQAALKKNRKTRTLAQIVGALGLTVTAPAAYFVVSGQINRLALLLWLANWLFAVNQIQFVQLRIHSTRAADPMAKLARGRWFLLTQSIVAVILLAACRTRILPGFVLLAFAPSLVRGLAWFFAAPQPLIVRRLGWTELAHNLAFEIILVIALTVPRP